MLARPKNKWSSAWPREHKRRGELSDGERLIRRLYEITFQPDATFPERAERVLALGCELFDLELGIVSHIEHNRYTVRHVHRPKSVPLAIGDQFELGQTYCQITLSAGEPVGFEHAGSTTVRSHPAYAAFNLEAYIGTAIRIRGTTFGTLNFSSASARTRKFRAVDIDCLNIMAMWFASEIDRANLLCQLEQLTRIDPLTQLLNRRGFEEDLSRCLARCNTCQEPVSALLLDIDNFKAINDNAGYQAGDEVLVQISRSLRACLRPGDLIARIGGDEFVAILPGADQASAARVANDVRTRIATSATFSVAVVSAAELTDLESLLAAASPLLHRGKRLGKDRVVSTAAE